ncbi:hypothetical protein EDD11_006912 [Mortierella claussenii]|nr:hypothetical protein EDD11_006912 [Mortierella claussenii]
MKALSPELALFCLFPISLHLLGTLFHLLFQCRLLGELLVGVLFGNLVFGTSNLALEKSTLILTGEIGVLGLIFEAGLGTNVRAVAKTGPRGALIALVGTVTPLITGFGFIYAILQRQDIQAQDQDETGGATAGTGRSINVITEALSSGAALASTSVACAITMMKQQRVLETQVGTLITTAAMIDDVASLILLGIISSIGGSGSESKDGGIRAMVIVQPLLASLGIMLIGFLGCVVVNKIKARIRRPLKGRADEAEIEEHPTSTASGGRAESTSDAALEGLDTDHVSGQEKQYFKHNYRHGRLRARIIALYRSSLPSLKLTTMVIVGLGYSILAEYLGSSRLLGAFVAGVFFSSFPDSWKTLFEQEISLKLQPTMSAIFFATIGFAIPLTKILEPDLFGWGVLYAIIASLSKLITAVLVPSTAGGDCSVDEDGQQLRNLNERWMVGTAMVARGELGLLMVQQGLVQGVMGQAVMVITTWSIVLCTLIGIGALSLVMR